MKPEDRKLLAQAKRDALAARGTLRLGRADGVRTECFLAHWPGTCFRCHKPIKRGQVIRYHNDYDGLVHDDCQPARNEEYSSKRAAPKPTTTGAKEPELCPHCWTQHRGECL